MFAFSTIRSFSEVPVDHSRNGIIDRLVATPEADGGYGWVTHCISDANFPTSTEPSLEGVSLEEVTGPYREVLGELRRRGRRNGGVAETLLYGIKNPEVQRRFWVWGLGQLCKDGGHASAVVLHQHGGERDASIGPVDRDFDGDDRLVTFPMSVEELAQRNAEDSADRTD